LAKRPPGAGDARGESLCPFWQGRRDAYITKVGIREFRDEVITGVRDLKGSVSTLHERMDRFIQGDKMTRRRSSADS
jgi:hypothetical protein